MRASYTAMSGFGVEPLKLGVKFSPPKLVILYRDGRSGKTHRRSMPLRQMNKNRKDLERLVTDLVEDPNHHRYLKNVPRHQILRMMNVIQDHLKGIPLAESLDAIAQLEKIDPSEDLNKIDSAALARKKLVMDETFEKNRKQIGDEGFQYDVQVDFGNNVDGEIESFDWDEDDDEGDF